MKRLDFKPNTLLVRFVLTEQINSKYYDYIESQVLGEYIQKKMPAVKHVKNEGFLTGENMELLVRVSVEKFNQAWLDHTQLQLEHLSDDWQRETPQFSHLGE